METSGLSLVIPVYNEGGNIPRLFDAIARHVGTGAEILICYDSEEDDSIPPVLARTEQFPSLKLVENAYGRGPLGAIRSGFEQATRPAVVVVMADLSDDLSCIPAMQALFQRGCKVVSGSRYMPGGRQIGGGAVKKTLSRLCGVSLHHLARLPTHDATNSFRLYDREFLRSVTVESDGGFELGLELTVKAHRRGLRVGEVPTTWTDRTTGKSRFRLGKWLPKYARWYLYAITGRGSSR